MTIEPADLFEYALIVPDLEKAMQHFHDAFGYTFSPILEGVLPMRDGAGNESEPPFRAVVTREFPHVELVEAQPGTSLVPPNGTGLHHVGYYVDDLAGEAERLVKLGFTYDSGGLVNGESPDGWVYLRMPDDTIIELVDRNRIPLRKAWIEGRLPDSPIASKLVPVSDELGGS